jgi:hypothetical protein
VKVSPINVIKELMNNGIMANINQQLDFDTAAIVLTELGFDRAKSARPKPKPRPPRRRRCGAPIRRRRPKAEAPTRRHRNGHVDHGKTSCSTPCATRTSPPPLGVEHGGRNHLPRHAWAGLHRDARGAQVPTSPSWSSPPTTA